MAKHYSKITGSTAAAIGTVISVFRNSAGNFNEAAYPGYLECDGREMNVSSYPGLYAILGTTYGGTSTNSSLTPFDGTGTFKLPDYRGQKLVGVGGVNGAGSSALIPSFNPRGGAGGSGDEVGAFGGSWIMTESRQGGEYFVGNVSTTGYSSVQATVDTRLSGNTKIKIGPTLGSTLRGAPDHGHILLCSTVSTSSTLEEGGSGQLGNAGVGYDAQNAIFNPAIEFSVYPLAEEMGQVNAFTPPIGQPLDHTHYLAETNKSVDRPFDASYDTDSLGSNGPGNIFYNDSVGAGTINYTLQILNSSSGSIVAAAGGSIVDVLPTSTAILPTSTAEIFPTSTYSPFGSYFLKIGNNYYIMIAGPVGSLIRIDFTFNWSDSADYGYALTNVTIPYYGGNLVLTKSNQQTLQTLQTVVFAVWGHASNAASYYAVFTPTGANASTATAFTVDAGTTQSNFTYYFKQVMPGVTYDVVVYTGTTLVQQGLIAPTDGANLWTRTSNTQIVAQGESGKKIFGDKDGTANDRDDFQITLLIGDGTENGASDTVGGRFSQTTVNYSFGNNRPSFPLTYYLTPTGSTAEVGTASGSGNFAVDSWGGTPIDSDGVVGQTMYGPIIFEGEQQRMAIVNSGPAANQVNQVIEAFDTNAADTISNANLTATNATIIFQEPETPITYTVSVTASSTTIVEGQSVVFTVSTSNGYYNTTLYWSTLVTEGNLTASDFTDNTLFGSVTINSSGIGTITRTTTSDAISENSENFEIEIRSGSSTGGFLARSPEVAIEEIGYSVSVSSIDGQTNFSIHQNKVNEGGTVIFAIQAQSVNANTTVYWELSGTNITAADFSNTSGSLIGSTTFDSNALAFVQINISSDVKTEGSESFQLKVRRTTSGVVEGSSSFVTITDSSTSPISSYTVTVSPTTVTKGSSVTFTVTSSPANPNAILYYNFTGVNQNTWTDSTNAGTFTLGSSGTGTITKTAQTVSNDGTKLSSTNAKETWDYTISAAQAGLSISTGEFVLTSSTPLVVTATIVPNGDIQLVSRYHRVKYLIKAF